MEKHQFKKKYGQNFLKDPNIVDKIIRVSGLDSKSLVIEVGPGAGVMTTKLAQVAKQVLAYEIDKDLIPTLDLNTKEYNNIDIIFQDFLEADISKDISKYQYDNLFFISNVPYYITTPIIMKLIKSNIHFNNIVMMVQKEVGDRLASSPGTKDYGSITVLLNYYYDITKEFNVSRKSFIPEPNVDSVIISLRAKKNNLVVNDLVFFEKLVRDSFQYKRKNIKNNLHNYDLDIVSEVLKKYDYDLTVRSEMLGIEVFVDLANSLKK